MTQHKSRATNTESSARLVEASFELLTKLFVSNANVPPEGAERGREARMKYIFLLSSLWNVHVLLAIPSSDEENQYSDEHECRDGNTKVWQRLVVIVLIGGKKLHVAS